MADLEQRRQQYNSNLSRRQWEADPQGKLIETLGPVLQWLGQQHRAKDPLTPEEQAIAKEALTQAGLLGSYLVPEIGIPANMAYEANRMQEEKAAGGDPSAVPLALAALPMGAIESRVGNLASRGARAVQGAEKALGPAAVIGGPLLMAGSAQAGEVGQDATGGGRGDTVRAGYEDALKRLDAEIAAKSAERDQPNMLKRKKDGTRPQYDKLDADVKALSAERSRILEQLSSYTSPEELAQSASDREHRRLMMMGGGAGLGIGAAALISALAAKGRGKSVEAFDDLASEVGTRLKGLPESPIVGTPAGDEMIGLVNEAYKHGGAKMPFTRGPGGTMQSRPPEGGLRSIPSALGLSKGESADQVFAKTGAYGDRLLPGMAMGEALVTGGLGLNAGVPFGVPELDPESAGLMQDLAAGGLAAAGGYKVLRAGAKGLLRKPVAKGAADVTSARIRLDRELAGPAGRAGAPEPPLLPGGPLPGSLASPPRDLPIASTGPQAAEPRLLEPPSTSGDVSSEIPGSLAPGAGAKKVKQPRPRRDAQGRLRDPMGQFTKPRAK